MVELMTRVEFWVAMLFGMAVKLRYSAQLTPMQRVLTVIVSVTGSLLFTETIYDMLGFTGENAKFACAALVALSCEELARNVMLMSPKDLLNLWRGKAP